MNEPWRRLATAAGIEPGYWDGLGTRRDLTDATARALLAALGHAADADPALSAKALEEAAWTAPLPALLHVAAGTSFSVDVTLPPAAAGQSLAWQVRLESGIIQDGSSALPHEPLDSRDIDGLVTARFRLTVELPAPLAPGYHRLLLPHHPARPGRPRRLCRYMDFHDLRPGRCHHRTTTRRCMKL